MTQKHYIYFYIIAAFTLHACSKSKVLADGKSQIKFSDKITNVTISSSDQSIGPCEPSICVSPLNQKHIVAGSVLDNVHLSQDGGYTWTTQRLKSPFGVFGDPVTIYDNKGRIYYAHLSNPKGKAYNSDEFLDRIVVQVSDDGVTFNEGTSPKNNPLKDQDKHWLAVSPLDNTILMSWTEFDKYGSSEQSDKSRILFSKSNDQGKSWSDAIAISEYEGDCVDDDNTTEGAVPAIGVDGTYYVVWSYNNRIYLDLSKDKGKTWMVKDKLIAEQPGGWAFDVPGISRVNGMPVIKIDHSNGPNRGTIYISWADQRNGTDDTDVWMIKSQDNGNTWSTLQRVNNDAKGKHQFFSWMDLDQSTGYLYWVFYDRRDHNDNLTDVFLAYSSDGGINISNKKISESPFLPSKEIFFGDYNDISAKNNTVRPIWTRLHNDKLSVHTAIINIQK